MSKMTKWYDGLDSEMQAYVDTRPLWKDTDMIYSCLLGFTVGVIVGLAACI